MAENPTVGMFIGDTEIERRKRQVRREHHGECPWYRCENGCGFRPWPSRTPKQCPVCRSEKVEIIVEIDPRFSSKRKGIKRELLSGPASVAATGDELAEARKIVEQFFPPDANPEAQWKTKLIASFASAFSVRDAEVREVLSGFIRAGVEFDDERMDYVVMQIDRRDLDAARELWKKVQPGD